MAIKYAALSMLLVLFLHHSIEGLSCWSKGDNRGLPTPQYPPRSKDWALGQQCNDLDENRCAHALCILDDETVEFAGCASVRSCEAFQENCAVKRNGKVIKCELCNDEDFCNLPEVEN